MNRRDTLKFMVGATAFATTAGTLARGTAFAQAKPAFTLPPLGYEYNALEPHIDTATMGFHHKNHHNAFIGNLNNLVEKYPDLASKPIEAILTDLPSVPEAMYGLLESSAQIPTLLAGIIPEEQLTPSTNRTSDHAAGKKFPG